MPRTAKTTPMPQVNDSLNGFNISINAFGEIVSSFEVQRLNTFLDKTVNDKKFKGVSVLKRSAEDSLPQTF